MNQFCRAPIAAMCMLIFGCGGGGNSVAPITTESTAAATSFPVAAAIRTLSTNGTIFTISGVGSDSKTYTQQVSIANQGKGVFEGVARDKVRTTSSLVQGSGTPLVGVSDDFYDLASMTLYGTVASNSYEVAGSPLPMPVSAPSGNVGVLSTGADVFTASDKSTKIFKANKTWSLLAIDSTSAWFCVESIEVSATTQAFVVSETDCYRITSVGVVSGFKSTVKFASPDLTITLQ